MMHRLSADGEPRSHGLNHEPSIVTRKQRTAIA
jgi:hypothetical protein